MNRRALGPGAGRARTGLRQHLLARLGRQRAHKPVDAQRARRRIARRRHGARALAGVILAHAPLPHSHGLPTPATGACSSLAAGRRAGARACAQGGGPLTTHATQSARSRHCPPCQNNSSATSAHAYAGAARPCSALGRCRPRHAAQGTSRSLLNADKQALTSYASAGDLPAARAWRPAPRAWRRAPRARARAPHRPPWPPRARAA